MSNYQITEEEYLLSNTEIRPRRMSVLCSNCNLCSETKFCKWLARITTKPKSFETAGEYLVLSHNIKCNSLENNLPVFIEHAAMIITMNEMRKNRRDQLNPNEVIVVVALLDVVIVCFLRRSRCLFRNLRHHTVSLTLLWWQILWFTQLQYYNHHWSRLLLLATSQLALFRQVKAYPRRSLVYYLFGQL